MGALTKAAVNAERVISDAVNAGKALFSNKEVKGLRQEKSTLSRNHGIDLRECKSRLRNAQHEFSAAMASITVKRNQTDEDERVAKASVSSIEDEIAELENAFNNSISTVNDRIENATPKQVKA